MKTEIVIKTKRKKAAKMKILKLLVLTILIQIFKFLVKALDANFIVNVINTQKDEKSNGKRKSRYDNSLTPPNNSQMVPFHSQVFNESSSEEENKVKEHSIALLPDS